MNRKQLVLSAALIVLLAMDAYSVYLYGYVGFFRMVLANFAGVTAFVDSSSRWFSSLPGWATTLASATSPRCHTSSSRSRAAALAPCSI
jgi:L-asparagine transporter-like permease